jgi:hypothetical protein
MGNLDSLTNVFAALGRTSLLPEPTPSQQHSARRNRRGSGPRTITLRQFNELFLTTLTFFAIISMAGDVASG